MINYDRIIEYWDKVFKEVNKGPIKAYRLFLTCNDKRDENILIIV